jgi:Na+-translocating ferredoxin:NAD+ oxidoreductase RnfD subunit
MIEKDIFDALKGLVNNRVYPMVMPQNPTLPALVYTRIATNAQNTIDAPPSTLDQCLMQIDAYAETYLAAKELAESMRAAMEAAPFKATLQTSQEFWEDTPKIYRVTFDFYCWEKRPPA